METSEEYKDYTRCEDCEEWFTTERFCFSCVTKHETMKKNTTLKQNYHILENFLMEHTLLYLRTDKSIVNIKAGNTAHEAIILDIVVDIVGQFRILSDGYFDDKKFLDYDEDQCFDSDIDDNLSYFVYIADDEIIHSFCRDRDANGDKIKNPICCITSQEKCPPDDTPEVKDHHLENDDDDDYDDYIVDNDDDDDDISLDCYSSDVGQWICDKDNTYSSSQYIKNCIAGGNVPEYLAAMVIVVNILDMFNKDD